MTMKRRGGSSLQSIDDLAATGQVPQSAAEIGFLCDQALARAKEKVAALIALPKKQRDFENTVARVDEITATLYTSGAAAGLLKEVHPDADTRARAEKCVLEIDKYANELMLRRDFYDAINEFKGGAKLKGQDKKYFKDMMLGFKRSGVTLPKDKRDKLQKLKDELSQLEVEFSKNISEDKSTIEVAPDDLKGYPELLMKGLEKKGDTYVLRTDPPTYTNVMQYVESEQTRKAMMKAFNNRAYPANVPILEKIIEKRTAMAALLGYKNYAEYQLEDLMAKNVRTAKMFLLDLRRRAKVKAKKDLEAMLKVKRERTHDPKAVIHPWDRGFYRNIIQETQYRIDDNEVSEYFSTEDTVNGLFGVAQKIFGLSFKEVNAPWRWHSDVKMYEVYSTQENQLIGRFYTDLYPRDNKYSHAAQFGIVHGRELPDGTYRVPTVAIVANFPKATGDRPALLKHSDVETFFHEFGHCLHSLVTRAKFGEQSGTSVKGDFVEAPSQMLENWVWEKESLNLFARHYKTGKPLPEDLLKRLLAVKNLNSGVDTQQQIYYADISLTIYSQGPKVDTDKVIRDLYEKDTLFKFFDGTHFQAAFGHLTGYGAAYYGYNWSKVYAEDMFTKFQGKNVLSPIVGMQYRDKVLSRGSSREEMASVIDFLGRKPNSKAFFKSLGL